MFFGTRRKSRFKVSAWSLANIFQVSSCYHYKCSCLGLGKYSLQQCHNGRIVGKNVFSAYLTFKEKQFWGSDGEGGEKYFHGYEDTANFQRKASCHFPDFLRFSMKFNPPSFFLIRRN